MRQFLPLLAVPFLFLGALWALQVFSDAPAPIQPESKGYATRRICADATTTRAAYLTGGENVGTAFTASRFGLTAPVTYGLAESGVDTSFAYFFDVNGSGQVTVTDAGAADTQGLDVEQVYPVRLTATGADGVTAFLDVGMWLDTSSLSVAGDGSC